MIYLKELIQFKGLTIAELSRKSGIFDKTIHRLEKGDNEPNTSTLKKLAQSMNCDIKDFYTDMSKIYQDNFKIIHISYADRIPTLEDMELREKIISRYDHLD